MAMRDRTALFLRYREEASALHGPPSHLRSRQGITPSEEKKDASLSAPVKRARTGAQEPEWMHTYRDLLGDMAEIEKTLSRISALYAKHLLPSFGESDHSFLESEIANLSGELTQMLHGAERRVRGIGKVSDGDEEALLRRNVQKRFATELQESSMAFRKKQKDYLNELRGQREACGSPGADRLGSTTDVAGVSRTSASGGSDSTWVDLGDERGLGGSVMSDAQAFRPTDHSNLASERAQEIARIAANINDLATIVKDLATLVVDQGTVLDRVDYNVEEVRVTTKNAVRELKIADRYQRKRHAFWCIVLLAIGCGVMLCLLILKWFT